MACLFATVLHGAEENANAEETATAEEESLPVSLDGEEALQEEESNETARDENFVPTIRITEDLPVAFPVDI